MLRAASSLSWHVGVEQQQRHAADLGLPDVGVQLAAAGQPERDDARGAVRLAQQRQRQAVGVEDRVGLLLPAVAVQALLEVAGLVEQADADDRHAEVGGGLEVVAGEDAQAAGVLRQHLGDAELGAEVGDRRRGAPPRPAPGPTPGTSAARRGRCRGRPWPPRPADEAGVGGQRRELVPGDSADSRRDGVLADLGPALRVDALEEVAGRRVPGPPQVAREVAQGGDRLGQDGTDAEPSDRLHEGSS